MNTIACKIDVTKIDKSRLFKGKKGIYLDCLLIEKESQYGDDFVIVQGVTKEERQAGIKGAILGNAKFLGGKAQPQQAPALRQATASDMPPELPIEDDVPF